MSVFISSVNWSFFVDWVVIPSVAVTSFLAWRNAKELRRQFSLSRIHSEIDKINAETLAVNICRCLQESVMAPFNISSEKEKQKISVYEAACERTRGFDTTVNLPHELANVLRAFIRLFEKIHNEQFISNADRNVLLAKLCTAKKHIGVLIHYAEGAQNISGKEIRFLKIMEKIYGIYGKCGVAEETYYKMNISPPLIPYE